MSNQASAALFRQLWVALDLHQMRVITGVCYYAKNERVTWDHAILQLCKRYVPNIHKVTPVAQYGGIHNNIVLNNNSPTINSSSDFAICLSESERIRHLSFENNMTTLLRSSSEIKFKSSVNDSFVVPFA